MKLLVLVLFTLGVACRAHDVLLAPEVSGLPEELIMPSESSESHPEWPNHEDTIHITDEEIHPTTCLICCKNKSPKFRATLCKDPKICFSNLCVKYMSKPRIHRLRTSGAENARSVRTEEQLMPVDENYCRMQHPMFSDMVMKPVEDDLCSFICSSPRSSTSPKHKTPNGWPCNGASQKICWDGACLSRAGPREDQLCKEKFSQGSLSKTHVKALVGLQCQVACLTSVDGTVSYLPRQDNRDCDPPDWLPKEMML